MHLRPLLAKIKINKIKILLLLLLLGIYFYKRHYRLYNFPHIPIEKIETYLYRNVTSNLILDPSKPNCEYNFTKNTNTLFGQSMASNIEDFTPTGISTGSYSPEHCNPAFSVALLVTYRNRGSQLDIFIPYIHNFLRKQNIHYKIFIIEQDDNNPWNKGALYNIGAKYAMAEQFPCLILHDIDLLPLDENNLYVCLTEPRHMSGSVDSLSYILPYVELVGGVMSIQTEQYKMVNGLSNKNHDWGGEDDDFFNRIQAQKLKILRFPRTMSRYIMLPHKKQKINDDLFMLLDPTGARRKTDGLSTVRYSVTQIKKHQLYILIQVVPSVLQ